MTELDGTRHAPTRPMLDQSPAGGQLCLHKMGARRRKRAGSSLGGSGQNSVGRVSTSRRETGDAWPGARAQAGAHRAHMRMAGNRPDRGAAEHQRASTNRQGADDARPEERVGTGAQEDGGRAEARARARGIARGPKHKATRGRRRTSPSEGARADQRARTCAIKHGGGRVDEGARADRRAPK